MGKGKNKAVEQDAVSKLRSERQRWAEERAKREIALLEKKCAQSALELERATSEEMETEIAQREEQVLVHLEAARQLQTRMESMLRREQAERDKGSVEMDVKLSELEAELATERQKSASLQSGLVEW